MRMIVIGGGASGASAAARLRRLDDSAEIIILEATDEISIANCGLPYYCSDVINSRAKMIVSGPKRFKDLLNIDVRLNSKVTSINRAQKTVVINNQESITYDKLVLALGANPIKPHIEGIDNKNIFTVRTLKNADDIKEHIKKTNAKNAIVIGGGFIGIEMAENFAHMGLNTKLIELCDQILPPFDKEIAAVAQNELRDNAVELILSDGVKSFGENEVYLSSGRSVPFDVAILSIGVKPETTLARECGLEIGERGGLKVNEFMQTSDPDIYAGGDSVEVKDFVSLTDTLIPLAGPANRQGRIIADNIAGYNSTYKNTQGSAVVKIFDLTAANVGNNEKQLLKSKKPYWKTFIYGNSHAGYYPNASRTLFKLLFGQNGEIFGAQAIGYEGVEKRIDVIASIMRQRGTVQDMLDSELCYAPPYSSAKDPVNILGMHADNILKGFMKPAFFEDIENSLLIDVRDEEIFRLRTIDGALNIPTSQMRERLQEIPKDKKVVLFCNTGFQSYVASRILIQRGYNNVYSLCGGIELYKELVKDKQQIVQKTKAMPASMCSSSLKIDACAMQCPGPIMKVSSAMKEMKEGETLEITSTDRGFGSDIEAWCKTTGNELVSLAKEDKIIKAVIQKGNSTLSKLSPKKNAQTIVVFSNDLDKALAAFIIANGAKAAGKDVTLFFTFWGLNILRKSNPAKVNKGITEKMFSFMMPKGADELTLSKMNMGGLGSLMMKHVMTQKNVSTLNELICQAKDNGIKFIACSMSMDVMGIKPEELIDGVETGGVAKYISESSNSASNLFI